MTISEEDLKLLRFLLVVVVPLIVVWVGFIAYRLGTIAGLLKQLVDKI